MTHYNRRSAEEMTERVLRRYNGSFLHPDEVVDEVKLIDARYPADAVRKHLRRLANLNIAETGEQGAGGRVAIVYRFFDPDKPYRPYMGLSPPHEARPGVRRNEQRGPHEDIIPLD